VTARRKLISWVAVAVVALVLAVAIAITLAPHSSDPREAAAQLVLAKYLRSGNLGRADYVTPDGYASRSQRFAPALSMSSRDVEATQRQGYQDILAVDVLFLGPPLAESFDLVRTADGRWFVHDHGGG